MDELLDFLERARGSLKTLDIAEVVEKTLEVSLTSLEFEAVFLPVAWRKRFVIPDVTDDFERNDGERVASVW
jgi:hypothetical protein